jgi:hypothetical protein
LRFYRTAVVLAVAVLACAFAASASATTLTYTITGTSPAMLAGIPNYFTGSASGGGESGSWSTQVYGAFDSGASTIAPGGYFNLTTGTRKTVTRSIHATYVTGTITPTSSSCAGQTTYTIEAELKTDTGGGHLTATVSAYRSQMPYGCSTYLLGISGNVTFVV